MKDGNKRYEGTRLLIRPASVMNLDIEDVSCTEDEGCEQDDAVFGAFDSNFSSPTLAKRTMASIKTLKEGGTKSTLSTANKDGDHGSGCGGLASRFPGAGDSVGCYSGYCGFVPPRSVDDIDAFCEIEGNTMLMQHHRDPSAAAISADDSTDGEEGEEGADRDNEDTPTPQAASLEDIVNEFSNHHTSNTTIIHNHHHGQHPLPQNGTSPLPNVAIDRR